MALRVVFHIGEVSIHSEVMPLASLHPDQALMRCETSSGELAMEVAMGAEISGETNLTYVIYSQSRIV